MINKDEFRQWKEDKVTQAYFNAIYERIDDVKDLLFQSAGQDPAADNFYRGFGAAYTEALEFRVDTEEE
jgi:hypothetical protein